MNETNYILHTPNVEREYLRAILAHRPDEKIHKYALALLRGPSIYTEFELGILIALVSPLRERMPSTWAQLMDLGKGAIEFRIATAAALDSGQASPL